MKALTIAALLMFWSAAASAQQPADREQRPAGEPKTATEVELVFESLDRNGDERISKAEAAREKSLSARFDGVDASGDGYLSRSEYRARPSAEPFE